MKKPCLWLATVLMVSFFGMAQATSAVSDVRQAEVYFGDLDLNSQTGAAALYRRIEVAARSVCQMPLERMLGVQAKIRRCVKDTTARAFTDANTPAMARNGGTERLASRALYFWAINR